MLPQSLLVTCLMGVSLSAVVVAAEVPSKPHITVIGRSQVSVKPDQALIQLQITQETQDTNSAKQQIDQQVSRYLTFLKQQGIQSSQIDASRLWSQRIKNPETPETNIAVAGYKNQQVEELKAKAEVTECKKPDYYRLSRQLTVTVQPLSLVEPLLTEALRCGLQELQSIQFGVADESEYRQQARKLAIQDAIQQAEQIAQQFSSRCGTIYSIRYRSSESPTYFASRSVAFAKPANSDQAHSYLPPILYFTDQVEATFRLQF